MNRTRRHLLYAVVWILALTTAVAIFAEASSGPFNPGLARSASQIGTAILLVGLAGIFYSWARRDAMVHRRTARLALVFAVLFPFLLFLSHAAYLVLTRGWQQGILATLKFICFLVASLSIWFLFSKLLGNVI
jgi:FtsH-binding integral membrane protein